MTKAIEARLSDLREMVSEQWFLDNPNSEVNEEVTTLISALEVALQGLKDAEFIFEGSYAIEGQSESELEKRDRAIMRFLQATDQIAERLGVES